MDTLAVADISRVDQPGHLFNIACSNVCGSITVDGKDAVSFAAAVSTVYVRPSTSGIFSIPEHPTHVMHCSGCCWSLVHAHRNASAVKKLSYYLNIPNAHHRCVSS